MIGYYAELTGDGRCVQTIAIEMPCQVPPTPGTHGNFIVPIDTQPVWVAPTPTSVLRFLGDSLQWVEEAAIEEAKGCAWGRIKEVRDAEESKDFEFQGVLYQPDVTKITGAVLEAMLPRAHDEPPFSIDWTVSDNSVVTLDAAQMVGLGRTLAARLNAIHQKGRELRALIDKAATPAEAYGYTWDSI